MSVPPVFVVILNHNGGALLARCVESFVQLQITQIIVVDNASTDGSLELLDSSHEKVEVHRLSSNVGYTGGNNLGIRLALERGAEYVLVVNADTIVINRSFVQELVQFATVRADAGIVGPRVFIRTTDRIQNTICHVPRIVPTGYWWFAQKLGWQRATSGKELVEAPVLNGVCILLRAEMLREIGLFDSHVFMYREDTDLALRARKQGWKSFYVPVDSILHLQSSEGYDYTSMVNFLLKRNAVHVLRQHGMTFDALGMALATTGLSFIRACVASFRGQDARNNWRFVVALSKAIKAAILKRPESAAFGPPHCEWPMLTNAATVGQKSGAT